MDGQTDIRWRQVPR